jgi:hypothetical protein
MNSKSAVSGNFDMNESMINDPAIAEAFKKSLLPGESSGHDARVEKPI